MKIITVTEFKAKYFELLQQVQDSGEPMLVTHRGQPMARIEPVGRTSGEKSRLGLLKGRLQIHGELVEASSTDDWEMLD